jgi:hypothetical protein
VRARLVSLAFVAVVLALAIAIGRVLRLSLAASIAPVTFALSIVVRQRARLAARGRGPQ